MDKKSLSERDICTKFITPAIESAGWDKITQLLEEVSALIKVLVCVQFMATKRLLHTLMK